MKLLKTTKGRLLLVLVCGLLLGGGGAGAYAFRQHRVRAQYMGWRAEGMQAVAAADNEKAVDLLGRFLRRYPEDVDALVAYARIRPLVKEPNRQHLQDTMVVLRHLLSLRPEMQEQRRALLRMYGDYGYAAEAVVTADKLLETTPKDPEVLGIRAKSLARMRRLGDALQAAQAWAEVAKQDIDAQILRLEVMQATGKSKTEIEKVAESLKGTLNDSPSFDWKRGIVGACWSELAGGESASFELVRGIASMVSGAPQEAERWIRKAAVHPGANLKVRQGVVGAFDGLGFHNDSLALLKSLVKDYGDPAQQRFLMHRLWEMESWDELLSYPVAEGSELAGDAELKGMIGMALARTGKTDQAKKVAADLVGAKDDTLAVAWGDVLGLMLTPEKFDARSSFDKYQAALKDAPGDSYIRNSLGQMYSRLGEPELAVTSFVTAAQQSPAWATPLLNLSGVYLNLGRAEQAMGAAAAAYDRSHSGAAAVQMAVAGNARIQSGLTKDDAWFAELLDGIEKAAPGAFYVLPERAAYLARANKKTEAVEVIKKALAAATPPPNAVLQRLASVSTFYGLGVEDLCYQGIEKQGGASASVALARAVTSFVGGSKESAVEQFEAVRKQSTDKDSVEWQIASARLMDVTRDPKAAATWVALADGHPDDFSVQQAVLTARTIRSDREFMDRTIERVKKLSGGEGMQWRVERARWILAGSSDKQSAEQASVLLSEALRMSADSIDARFLQATALERQGNTGAAIEQLTTLVKQNPLQQGAALYLAQLLQQRGDFDKAREYLEPLTRSRISDKASRETAARLMSQQGDVTQAIKLLEDGKEEPGGQNDLLLAMLYRQQNDLKHADELCTKLMKKPDLAVIAFAVDLYGAMGRDADARNAIAMFKDLKAEPGSAELLLAAYAARYGKAEEALQQSRKATELAPKNPAAWKALIVFSLGSGKYAEAAAAADQGLKAVPDDKYLLALMGVRSLISTGMADARLKPLALQLAQNPEMGGTKAVLQILTAPGASAEAQPAQLAKLKQVSDQNPLNLPVQLYTAGRFMAASQWDAAASIATRAASSFPLSPEAAGLAANALLGGQRWAEAVEFAKTLRARTPNALLNADMLAATAYMSLNQPGNAVKQLAGDMPEVEKDVDKYAPVLALYGAALHRSGKADEAEKLITPALQKSEAVRTAWIDRVTRDLPVADAVNWVSRVAAMGGDSSVAGQVQLAGVSSALGKKGDSEKLKELSRKLRAKVAERKDLSPMALAVLASQAEGTNDLKEAEALYRRAIAVDPSLAVVKNNLAMLRMQQGDLKEAISLAEGAIRQDPSLPNFYETLSQVQAKAGDKSKAVDTVKEAVRRDPEHPTWRVSLAERLVDAEQNKEALEVFKALKSAAVDKDPEFKDRMKSLMDVLEPSKVPVSSVPH
jgi:tetratricopeptide (TPR) repeat protein